MTNKTNQELERRNFFKGAALSAGAVALLSAGIRPTKVLAQDQMSAGTVHSFSTGGLTFHTYVSPAEALHVTSHIVELENELIMVDTTMLPPTAAEVASLIASTGKKVNTAVISHEHPDHWGAAAAYGDLKFSTLPAIRNNISNEGDPWVPPENVLNGPDLKLGMTEIDGTAVEFRHYQNTESFDMVVTVFPEQKVAIIQDLVYNGLYAAPGIDRANWIATLEALREDASFDTLLVGHGLPTSRGDLDHMIAYVKTMHEIIENASTPDEATENMKKAYPAQAGEFLLSLIGEYWSK